MQEQLVQSEKLASLGQLTAGIAHEIKNPLNFVNNFSELSAELIEELRTTTDAAEREEVLTMIKDNLQKITHHGKRADQIVASMLQHSHAGTGEKQLTDINKLCDEYADLALSGMKANVADFNCEIIKLLTPNLPKVDVVQQDLSRVLLNLINNACYAAEEKAHAEKEKGTMFHPQVSITTKKQNDKIVIAVKDNGNGIPAAIKQKIFEPFFTTKPTGKGTGLGLSICFDIIKAQGGTITVNSEEGKFAEFVITL